MSTKCKQDLGLKAVGQLLTQKRISLGPSYYSREKFITNRSIELFQGEDWISLRHLANLESGYNWISIEMLVKLAAALEQNPVDLFSEILLTYQSSK